MPIPIYKPQPQTEEYALRLISEKDMPVLCIVNKATGIMVDRGRLCYIDEDGYLHRSNYVNARAAEDLGIALNDDRIALR